MIPKFIFCFALLAILSLSSCWDKPKTAINGIEHTKHSIDKEKYDLIFDYAKEFPNNTQLAIAFINDKDVEHAGVIRKNDTLMLIDNQNSVFEIGSITKVFTATLLSHFVMENKLGLNDNIQDYLEVNINTEENISFQQLANHTSGLPRLPSNSDVSLRDRDNPYKNYGKKELLEYLTSELELDEKPGTTYAYSNLGSGLLGFLLAEISETSYEMLLQQVLFKKYDMKASTSLRENTSSRLVQGLKPNGEATSNWDFDALAGCGAVFSSVTDLSKFGIAQFQAKNDELTLTQKPTFKINNSMSIGLGWHILKRKKDKEWIWHNGGTGGYSSSFALDLSNKKGVIILSNVSAYHKNMSNIDKLCFELMK
jgi:CubicO group peptidase (beta-lactamase class C family)